VDDLIAFRTPAGTSPHRDPVGYPYKLAELQTPHDRRCLQMEGVRGETC